MDKIELQSKATELRKKLGEDENSYIDIFKLAAKIENLTIVLYPLGKNISGICIKNPRANLIAINSTMSYGRQRFSLAHEFYHLFYDKSENSAISVKSFDKSDESEIFADIFASYFLAPYYALRSKIKEFEKNQLSIENIIELEQLFGMSHQAMLWRLEEDGYIEIEEYAKVSDSIVSIAKRLGYSDELYFPTANTNQKKTYGNYIKQAEKLKDANKISIGKYEELLIDAFRYDIVYGDEDNGGEMND